MTLPRKKSKRKPVSAKKRLRTFEEMEAEFIAKLADMLNALHDLKRRLAK